VGTVNVCGTKEIPKSPGSATEDCLVECIGSALLDSPRVLPLRSCITLPCSTSGESLDYIVS
jgi:hypothetical protein